MKLQNYIFALVIVFSYAFSCSEDEETTDEEPDRTTVLLTLNNNSGLSGCTILNPVDITFIISYRDVQANVDILSEQGAFLNINVEDGEIINVIVQRTSDDLLLADRNISVRTTSRPAILEGEPRTISYCTAFELFISNF